MESGRSVETGQFCSEFATSVQSGTFPESSCYYDRENLQYNQDRSENIPHPELGTSVNSSPHPVNSHPD